MKTMFIGVIIVAIIALVALFAFDTVSIMSGQSEIQRIQEMENALMVKGEECYQLILNQRVFDNDFTNINRCNDELSKMSEKLRLAKYEIAGYTQQEINESEQQVAQRSEDRITRMNWERFETDLFSICGYDYYKCGTAIQDNSVKIRNEWLTCYGSRSNDGDFSLDDEDICKKSTLSSIGIVIDEYDNIIANYAR